MSARRRNEEGAVLLLALIFMTVVGVVVATLLTLAQTDVRNTVSTRTNRTIVYAADAAIESAINSFATTGCPTLPPTFNGVPIAITCASQSTTVPGSGANAPPAAISVLADTAEVGFTTSSSNNTTITGGLYSNSTTSGSTNSKGEIVSGPLVVRGACPNMVYPPSPYTPQCNYGAVVYPPAATITPVNGVAPAAYQPATLPTNTPAVPTCPAGGGPVTMTPGRYTSGKALTDLFRSCTGTSSTPRVFWFPPATSSVGVYYLDFQDLTASDYDWKVEDSRTVVVGGTLKSGETLASIAAIAEGSRCDDQQHGVQFVFNGGSHLSVLSGQFDACAEHDAAGTAQEIAVYGLRPVIPNPNPVNAPASPGVAAPTTGTVSTSIGNSTQVFALDRYAPTTLQPGDRINSITVRVSHADTVVVGSMSGLQLTGTATATGSVNANLNLTSSATSGALHDDDTVLPPTFNNLAALNSLSASMTAKATKVRGNDTTFSVTMGVPSLIVNYTPGGNLPSPCRAVVPYDASGVNGSCPLIKTAGSSAGLSIRGTVYAPWDAFDIQLTSGSFQVFGRGIVARTLRTNVTSSACTISRPCQPAFQLPAATTVAGPTTVVFTGSAAGNRRIRALVSYPPTGGTQVCNSATTSGPCLKQWSVMNEAP